MDSTCSPATLIIVVVWFHPALPFGGQRRDFASHAASNLAAQTFCLQSLSENQDQWD